MERSRKKTVQLVTLGVTTTWQAKPKNNQTITQKAETGVPSFKLPETYVGNQSNQAGINFGVAGPTGQMVRTKILL